LLQSSIVVASWKEAAAAAAAAAIQLPEMGIEIASEIQSTKLANSNANMLYGSRIMREFSQGCKWRSWG
jgi:hypothetical protein